VDEEFKHYRFLAEKAIQTGEIKAAEEDLKAILEVVPEVNDPRASYAQERIRALERGVMESD
jgi:cytochrome c-type biogenesis protein CcmH/NrfG